jgi:hypothetical protein
MHPENYALTLNIHISAPVSQGEIKITIFCDMTQCRLIHRYQSFGGTSYLNLQSKTVKLEASGFSEKLACFIQSA